MDFVIYIGLLAAVCTTGAFVPQVVKVWGTKSTHDLSLKTFLLLSVGISLWLVYGLYLKDLPIIAANTVSIGLIIIILAFKIKYK